MPAGGIGAEPGKQKPRSALWASRMRAAGQELAERAEGNARLKKGA